MRKLAYTLIFLTSVVIVGILGLFVLLTNEGVSRKLIYHNITRFGNKLTIRDVQGSILTGLRLYGIKYGDAQQHTDIERAQLSWRPLALLGGRVHVKTLYVEGITHTASATRESHADYLGEVLSPASITLDVAIDYAELKGVVLRHGDIQHVLEHVRFTGQATEKSLHVTRFEAESKDFYMALQGDAELHRPYPFRANVKWNARLPDGLKAEGKGEISGDINGMKFTHRLREPFLLETTGGVEIGHVLAGSDLAGGGQSGRHLSTGEAAPGGDGGQSDIRNPNDSYSLTFRGDFNGQNMPPIHVQAHGRTDLTGFQLEKLDGHTLGGTARVKGHILWHSKPTWNLTVDAMDIDPGMHWPQFPGKLTLKASVQGNINAGTPTLLLRNLEVAGQLRKQPFQTMADLRLHGDQIMFDKLMIRSGENQLNLRGTAATDLDLRFNVDAQDPATLWPGIRGHLQGKGVLTGTRSNPTASTILEGKNLSYRNCTLKDLHADLRFASNDPQPLGVRLTLLDLRVADRFFRRLSFEALSDLKSHRARGDVESPSARTEVQLVGSCQQDSCEWRVNTVSIDLNGHGKWDLVKPINLLASCTEVKPVHACWFQDRSTVCVKASYDASSGWKTEGDVSAPPLKYLIHLVKLLKENLEWKKDS